MLLWWWKVTPKEHKEYRETLPLTQMRILLQNLILTSFKLSRPAFLTNQICQGGLFVVYFKLSPLPFRLGALPCRTATKPPAPIQTQVCINFEYLNQLKALVDSTLCGNKLKPQIKPLPYPNNSSFTGCTWRWFRSSCCFELSRIC